MIVKRRQFNKYLASLVLSAGFVTAPYITAGEPSSSWYASASVDNDEQHWLVVFNKQGEELLRYPLPSRAHQVLKHPTKPWVLVVARRPGKYLLVIDIDQQQLVKQITSSENQHFCGHMQISQNGQYLFSTENISATSEGLVVARDIEKDFVVVNQFSSGGIGPHQLIINHKTNTMIVANGGIHTRDRKKFNLEEMQPNLTYIDLATSKIIEQVQLSQKHHQLSIRHLDISAIGEVAIAMQYQGERTDKVPLVALHKQGQALRFLTIPEAQYYQLKHYCGSVCFDHSGSTLAASAPKGDTVLFWDIASGQFIDDIRVRDGCGIVKTGVANNFIVSSGGGSVYQINPREQSKTVLLKNDDLQWDNHLAVIG